MIPAELYDWLEFNLSLSERISTGERKAIAFDPSYISKSGKETPRIGYIRSGTAGVYITQKVARISIEKYTGE